MNFLKKTETIYIGFALAVAAIVAGVFWPDYQGILWTVAGLFGVGSLESLRQQIDANGWKTHALAIVSVLVFGLQIFGVITPDQAHLIYLAFAPLFGATITQALVKSPTASVKGVGK